MRFCFETVFGFRVLRFCSRSLLSSTSNLESLKVQRLRFLLRRGPRQLFLRQRYDSRDRSTLIAGFYFEASAKVIQPLSHSRQTNASGSEVLRLRSRPLIGHASSLVLDLQNDLPDLSIHA